MKKMVTNSREQEALWLGGRLTRVDQMTLDNAIGDAANVRQLRIGGASLYLNEEEAAVLLSTLREMYLQHANTHKIKL
jgi:hypothetical protein